MLGVILPGVPAGAAAEPAAKAAKIDGKGKGRSDLLFKKLHLEESEKAQVSQQELLEAMSKLMLTLAARSRAMSAILLTCHLCAADCSLVRAMEKSTQEWSKVVQVMRDNRVAKREQEAQAGLPHHHQFQAMLDQMHSDANQDQASQI